MIGDGENISTIMVINNSSCSCICERVCVKNNNSLPTGVNG